MWPPIPALKNHQESKAFNRLIDEFFLHKYANLSANEYQPTAAKSMPKPVPHNNFSKPTPPLPPPTMPAPPKPQQPTYPTPFGAPPKPIGKHLYYVVVIQFCSTIQLGNKPAFNNNAQVPSGAGNQAPKKGTRGTALLNQNDNANQIAICHTCGVKIR